MTTKTITVTRDLLATNKAAAAAIRRELRSRGILGVNLMSSPGSGKTTFSRPWPTFSRAVTGWPSSRAT